MTKDRLNRPRMVEISKIQIETPLIKTLYFTDEQISEIASPGQYIMVWIPKIDEIPLSLSNINPSLAITVKKVGDATEAIHALQKGNRIGIRGPYGHGFSIRGESPLIVGGGIGMAPFLVLIRELQEHSKQITVINGAKTKKELLFLKQLQALSKEGIKCIYVTDDGSFGEKGFASDIALQKLREGVNDHVYTCGPEPMIWNLFKTTEELNIPLEASLERIMKCGIGLCGQCSLDPIGYRVCVEGPVFDSETLRKILDFGKYRRNFGGTKVEI